MDQNRQPANPETGGTVELRGAEAPPGTPAPTSAATTAGPSKPRGLRRVLATLALTIGLLTIGGVSVVMAASPSPASTPPASSGTTTPTTKHSCPNMGSGANGSHNGPTNPSSSPSN